MRTTRIITDNSFVLIPEWILFSDISDGAVALYAVLRANADSHPNHATPTRKHLAKDMGKSTRSIDRYLKELRSLGVEVGEA